jgi:toxin ParE1/3/4
MCLSVAESRSRMSSSRRLEFTARADDDLRLLLANSLTIWGEERRDTYADRLTTAMHELLVHPHLGRARDDLSPGLRSLRAEAHMIYYFADERTVTIVRLLHSRMDPSTHLKARS